MGAVEVPAGLVEATQLREGNRATLWLDELPAIVDNACRRWQCTLDGEPVHGGVALVVPIRHPRGPAMLKVSFPHPGNVGEALGLRTFDGRGSVELFDAGDSGLVLVLERVSSFTLTDYATTAERVEEAVEISGQLARRLAVDPLPGVTRLAETTAGWREQLDRQVATSPAAVPPAALEEARHTIDQLAGDTTTTMLHGDLHFGNILHSSRARWVTIDPRGWSGTAAFDAFTAIIGGRQTLKPDRGLYRAAKRRVHRFATAAGVDSDLAMACCQARAVSSYLYQLQVPGGDWFDLQFLCTLALGEDTD